jgi:hypothetical protein
MWKDEKDSFAWALANDLIEYLIQANGLDWMVEYLLASNVSLARMLDLGFDEKHIREIAKQMEKRI